MHPASNWAVSYTKLGHLRSIGRMTRRSRACRAASLRSALALSWEDLIFTQLFRCRYCSGVGHFALMFRFVTRLIRNNSRLQILGRELLYPALLIASL